MIKRKLRGTGICFAIALAAIFFLMPANGDCLTRIAVGGNGVGGVYYLYSGALSQMINKYIPDVEATVEVCAGSSVEHIKRIQLGELQVGPAMNDSVFKSLQGIGQFKTPHDKIRTLFTMYPAVMQGAALASSGIRTFSDLVGKRVTFYTPGSGSYNMGMAVLDALGMDPKKINLQYLNMMEGVNAIRNGKLDVQFSGMAYPAPWIMDLSVTHKIVLISASDEELAKINEKYPYYMPSFIPGGTYTGVDKDAKMPGIWNSYIGSADLPDELAYQITKVVYEHIDDLKKAYKGAGWATPENTMKYGIAPLHPGAVKYYQEKKVEIPSRLMPK
ncbi:MAG: TAXI family TRAP transporter solute-binding subunit [Deltaproteobacteria bacterium]|nr:TAXI family TRAP transporter solute-binding subunit [Deltaproteobacteria bacterium]